MENDETNSLYEGASKKSRSLFASLEKRAQQLEQMLKLTKPITDFVQRVEKIEQDLKSGSSQSHANICFQSVKRKACSPNSVPRIKKCKTLSEAYSDKIFIEKVVQVFKENLDLNNSFFDEKGVLKAMEENIFIKYIIFAISSFFLGDDYEYNLQQLEIHSLNMAKAQLPQIYSEPTVLNIKGLLLVGIYYFRVKKMYSAKKFIDYAFSFCQIVASKLNPYQSDESSPGSFKAGEIHFPERSDREELLRVWPSVLMAKRYTILISGNPSMIFSVDTAVKFLTEQTNQEHDPACTTWNRSTQSIRLSKFIDYSFSVNSQVQAKGCEIGGAEYNRIIESHSIQLKMLEKDLLDWQAQLSLEKSNPASLLLISKLVNGSTTKEEHQRLYDYFFVNFLTILAYWPTVFSFKCPIPSHSAQSQALLNAAFEIYRILEYWDSIIASPQRVTPMNQLPLSVRTVFLTVMVFLNHSYHCQEECPSSANFSKARVRHLEQIIARHGELWEGSAATLEEIKIAKEKFEFNIEL